VRRIVFGLALLLAAGASAQPRTPLTRAMGDALYCRLTVCISTTAADARYLKLAADNDPLTGQLALAATGLSFPGATSGTTSLVATAIAGTTALTLPAATDTLVGKATTDVFLNKSISLATNTVTATSLELRTALSDESGSGAALFGTSPTITGNFTIAGTSTYTVDTSVINVVDVFNQNTTGNVSLRTYRNRTDASNYQLFNLGWFGSDFQIGVTKAGSGTQIPLSLTTGGVIAVRIGTTQNVELPVQAVTAGTMTGTHEAVSSRVKTCRSWTNAQVAALAGTAGDIAWGTLPAKSEVIDAKIFITGAAAGPTTVTVSLGRTSASYIDYIVASDAKAAANTVYGDTSGERGTNLTGYDLPSYTGTTLINAHFISTGANLSTTTGSTGLVCITHDRVP
jgi:hypothetical protein